MTESCDSTLRCEAVNFLPSRLPSPGIDQLTLEALIVRLTGPRVARLKSTVTGEEKLIRIRTGGRRIEEETRGKVRFHRERKGPNDPRYELLLAPCNLHRITIRLREYRPLVYVHRSQRWPSRVFQLASRKIVPSLVYIDRDGVTGRDIRSRIYASQIIRIKRKWRRLRGRILLQAHRQTVLLYTYMYTYANLFSRCYATQRCNGATVQRPGRGPTKFSETLPLSGPVEKAGLIIADIKDEASRKKRGARLGTVGQPPSVKHVSTYTRAGKSILHRGHGRPAFPRFPLSRAFSLSFGLRAYFTGFL